ncbi:immunoglobulin lambda-1 light chain-like [Latimeria chalumnae]|uniref:immunoglobulin lambda-1 light chain-like n=1 Tax=Latimeria chalumnae TaxID=7897 RepID=UPI00313DEE7C
MANLYLLLLLVTCPCFSDQAATFRQTTPVMPVSPGNRVTLECSVSNGNVNELFMHWIRQTPGKAPEGVLGYAKDQTVYRAPNITERFVPSRDSSVSKHFLTISDVRETDDSVYFCFIFYTTGGEQAWGEGTRVKVLKSDLLAPSVNLLPPAPKEMASSGTVTLTCLVSSFYPGFIEVLWSVDGTQRSAGVTTSPVALGSDQTYLLSSYLSVPTAEWDQGKLFSCGVRHESRETLIQKSISINTCKEE